MAGYFAIAAISAALQSLLLDARAPEFSGAQVEILQIPDFQKPKPVEEGISILLYRVAVSSVPRTLSSRFDSQGRRLLPPLPVDLYYLFTPWGRTAVMQQRLLGWLMRTLEDLPALHADLLNHYGGAVKLFGDGETVKLIPETLALQDLSNLWDVLKPHAHVSAAYVARMVYLETLLQPVEGEPVQTRDFAYDRVPS
jgi:hypothetical protein